MFRDAAQRLAGQFIESVISSEPRDQLSLHARRPETFYVIGDAGDRVVASRLSAKKIADVVCHSRQVLCAADEVAVVNPYCHVLMILPAVGRRYRQRAYATVGAHR